MNPGIGMPEMLVVLIVALVVVGPQQLPLLMRRVGRFLGQARMMARDFQRSFEDIGRESELDELRKEIAALRDANPVNEISKEVDAAAREADIDAEAMRQLKMRDAGLDPHGKFGKPSVIPPGTSGGNLAAKPGAEKMPDPAPKAGDHAEPDPEAKPPADAAPEKRDQKSDG